MDLVHFETRSRNVLLNSPGLHATGTCMIDGHTIAYYDSHSADVEVRNGRNFISTAALCILWRGAKAHTEATIIFYF